MTPSKNILVGLTTANYENIWSNGSNPIRTNIMHDVRFCTLMDSGKIVYELFYLTNKMGSNSSPNCGQATIVGIFPTTFSAIFHASSKLGAGTAPTSRTPRVSLSFYLRRRKMDLAGGTPARWTCWHTPECTGLS